MRENSFTKKMKAKSNTELETIFENKSDYTDEAIPVSYTHLRAHET